MNPHGDRFHESKMFEYDTVAYGGRVLVRGALGLLHDITFSLEMALRAEGSLPRFLPLPTFRKVQAGSQKAGLGESRVRDESCRLVHWRYSPINQRDGGYGASRSKMPGPLGADPTFTLGFS